MADTSSLPEPNELELQAGDTLELPAAVEAALPDSTAEVAALSAGEMAAQTEQAEEFGEMLMSIQNIVERYGNQLDELNKKIHDLKESLANLFVNNEELQQAEEQQKTIQTDVKAKRQRIKESPEAVQFQMKMKEFQEEANEIKQTISNHLIRYYQMTGSQVIETSSGEEREFSVSARLKGKKKS